MLVHSAQLCRRTIAAFIELPAASYATTPTLKDAVQEAYVSAFTNLASYRGEGSLKNWLSRIVVNECLGRMRQRHSTMDLTELEQQQSEAQIIQFPQPTPNDDPERTMAQRQIIHLWSKRLTICRKLSVWSSSRA
jgi:DNA-directed RNA polymerase specialized sigma24 family protein